MASIKDKVRSLTRRASHRTLADLLRRLNPAIRGWCVGGHVKLPIGGHENCPLAASRIARWWP